MEVTREVRLVARILSRGKAPMKSSGHPNSQPTSRLAASTSIALQACMADSRLYLDSSTDSGKLILHRCFVFMGRPR